MGKEKEGKESYYLFVGGNVPSICKWVVYSEESMESIYAKYRDKDGILYISYQEQQSFWSIALSFTWSFKIKYHMDSYSFSG